jgi:hypothetical protein
MMNLDFFQRNCQEKASNNTEFGLCDDEAGAKAYVFSPKTATPLPQ